MADQATQTSDQISANAAAQTTYINQNIIEPAVEAGGDFLKAITEATIYTPPTVTFQSGTFIPFGVDLDTGRRPILDTLVYPYAPIPTFSSSFTFGELDIPTEPALDAVAPDVNLPVTPDASIPSAPSEPLVNQVTVPNSPVLSFPIAPTISDIPLPAEPTMTFVEFTQEYPEFLDLIPYIPNFEYSEVEYISSLKDTIYAKLEAYVNAGGTPLDSSVEDAIYNRDLERNNLALQENLDRSLGQWTKRGFALPDGVLARLTEEIYDKDRMDKDTRSKDIAIKQTEMARQHLQFSLDKGISLENLLIEHHNKVADRSLAAARAIVELGISLYNARVSHYNSMINAYQVAATVYEAQIRAEMQKVELYKTQLQGAQLKQEIQMGFVEIYKTQLSAIETLVSVYKAELEGARLTQDIEKTKVEIFKALIDAYSAQVQAKAAEFGLYKAQIDGEMAKIDIYGKQVDAYSAQVGAYKTVVDARAEELKVNNDTNRLKLEKYTTDITAWKIDYESKLEKVKTQLSKYSAETNLYTSENAVYMKEADIKVTQQQMMIANFEAQIKIKAEEALANLNSAKWAADLHLTGATTGETVINTRLSHAINTVQSLYNMYSGSTVTKAETA